MLSLVKTLETTKAYIAAFNNRDMAKLESMLDASDITFVRQTQPTIVGVEPIMRRTQKTFERLDRQGHQLHMIRGIIDFKGMKAYPCMIGIMDGARFSVVILDCKNNGLITSISILLSNDMVEKARPTEPLAQKEIEELHASKSVITEEELIERKNGLKEKAILLMKRFEEEGQTQELLGKWERMKEAEHKLKVLEEDLKLAKMFKSDNLEEV